MRDYGAFIGSGGAQNFAWDGVLMSAGDFNDKLQEMLLQLIEIRQKVAPHSSALAMEIRKIIDKPKSDADKDYQIKCPHCPETFDIRGGHLCAEKRKDEVSAGKCPECGLGIRGVDPLCDKHYSEYLGTNRARGNNEND